LLQKYPTEVKLVHKNFPIRSHKYAIKAAVAALAADRQGKFWEFHDELFKDYNNLNDEKIQAIGARLGLDEAQFKAHQKNPAVVSRIREDYEEAIRLKIRGVPTLFINGRRVQDRRLENMEAMIDEELAALKTWTGKAAPQ